jgi:hypothetical protein
MITISIYVIEISFEIRKINTVNHLFIYDYIIIGFKSNTLFDKSQSHLDNFCFYSKFIIY